MSKPRDIPIIGLLGGVGAGKSTVAAQLETLGCRRIDADAIGHALLGEPDVKVALRERFGADIFADDGSVDRAALGRRVFDDAESLAALNAIMHPRILRGIEQQIGSARQDVSVAAVVLDAAVMVDAGWHEVCTRLVFVEAPDDQRRDRVACDRGWTGDQWRRREDSQIPLDSKVAMCDDTLSNGSTVSCLEQQVRELYKKIVHATRPS